MDSLAALLVNLFLSYLGLGLIFAVAFVRWGVGRVDSKAAGTSWRFKLLLLPGAVALWPLLLKKWITARRHDPST